MVGKRGPKTPMTDEHKAALAKGRLEGRIVRDYLEGLRATKPKRGRKRTPETITKRLTAIDGELASATPIEELLLIQERRDLQAELAAKSNSIDMDALEAEFVGVAKSYSDSKSISYASWRDVGVPASALKRAGISRGD
jgi:NTP pyrophosphatase (non-canonical NTP hydrolase)